MRKKALCAEFLFGACLAACRGTAPIAQDRPHAGMAAVIIAGQFQTPNGPAKKGDSFINLESREGDVYRLRVSSGKTILYQIEPGFYHFAPTRSLFGTPKKTLRVAVNGRNYRIAFPKELINESAFEAKPSHVAILGLLAISISAPLPGRGPIVNVNLNDMVSDRRAIVQGLIGEMMAPSAARSVRKSALSWLNSLQTALIRLSAEPQSPLDASPN
ncbi:MAG: hypothetical protein ACYCPQ_04485 [Elusimicrobiota bacterium]